MDMKIILFMLLVFSIAGCSNSAKAGKDVEATLDKAFEALNGASLGIEYPPSQEVLDGCIKNKDASCLKAYTNVQDAKKTILKAIDDDAGRALNITLDRRMTKCNDKKIFEDDAICIGAIISLYFFNKQNQQQKIMDALRTAPSVSFKRAFATNFEWMYYRPDPNQWIEFVNSLSDQSMPPDEKKLVIEDFKQSEQEIMKFGVML